MLCSKVYMVETWKTEQDTQDKLRRSDVSLQNKPSWQREDVD